MLQWIGFFSESSREQVNYHARTADSETYELPLPAALSAFGGFPFLRGETVMPRPVGRICLVIVAKRSCAAMMVIGCCARGFWMFAVALTNAQRLVRRILPLRDGSATHSSHALKAQCDARRGAGNQLNRRYRWITAGVQLAARRAARADTGSPS
jgi:hypothetical protein